MTLNGVMALTLRYFNQFAKYAFQLITAGNCLSYCFLSSCYSYSYIYKFLVVDPDPPCQSKLHCRPARYNGGHPSPPCRAHTPNYVLFQSAKLLPH